jgi:hypothetical protein
MDLHSPSPNTLMSKCILVGRDFVSGMAKEATYDAPKSGRFDRAIRPSLGTVLLATWSGSASGASRRIHLFSFIWTGMIPRPRTRRLRRKPVATLAMRWDCRCPFLGISVHRLRGFAGHASARVLATSVSFKTFTVTVLPSLNRRTGPGTEPL